MLRGKRSVIEKANDAREWNDIVHELHSLLSEHNANLPENVRHDLEVLAQMTDTSPEKILQTYAQLDKALARTIASLNTGLPLPAVIGIVVAVAALGTTAIILNSVMIVEVVNSGCGPIDLTNIPSTSFVQYSNSRIDSGERQTIRINSILSPQIDVENKLLQVYIGSFNFPADADEIWYNGNRILQKSALTEDGELRIVCR